MRIQKPARGMAAVICGCGETGAYAAAAGLGPGCAPAADDSAAAAAPAMDASGAAAAVLPWGSGPAAGGGAAGRLPLVALRARAARTRVYTTAPNPKKPSNL